MNPNLPAPFQQGHHYAMAISGLGYPESVMMPVPNQHGHHRANAGLGFQSGPVPNLPPGRGSPYGNEFLGEDLGLGYPGSVMMPVPNRFGHRHANSGTADDYGLGDDTGMASAAKHLEQGVIEAAAKVAAVQMGVAIGLMFVAPPVGTIVGAVLACIQLVSGVYVKNQTKEIIANTVGQIKSLTDSAEEDINHRINDVALQEYPSAQLLAASDASLGANWFTTVARKIAAPIAKPLTSAGAVPIKAGGSVMLRAGIAITGTVGDKQGQKKLQAQNNRWPALAASMQAKAVVLAADPVALTRFIHAQPAKYLLGTSQLDTVRQKCKELLQQAAQAVEQSHSTAVVLLNSPEFHDQVRTQLALSMRDDPTALSQARDVANIEAQAQATANQAITAARTGQSSVTGGLGVVTLGAAAVLGFLWLKG